MSADADAVLVDTSVWIEVLRCTSHSCRPLVDELIAADRARLCAVVAAELIQGAVTAKDLRAAEELAKAVALLEADDDAWLDAGRLGQRLRAKGVTVGLLDCYLAQIAMTHGCGLLSLDKHFPLIAKHSTLKLIGQKRPLSS